jgi:hypothetical protein
VKESGERGENALYGGCVDETGEDVYEGDARVADREFLNVNEEQGNS